MKRPPRQEMTAREREVCILLAKGHTAKCIGEILGVTARTAEHHRFNIRNKLRLRGRSQAVDYAVASVVMCGCCGEYPATVQAEPTPARGPKQEDPIR